MKLAKFEVKNKKIGENTYYVRPLPPLKALKLYGDLQKTVTAALKNGLIPSGATEDLKENLLGSQINVGNIIAQLGENFSGEVLEKYAERLLDEDYVSVKRKDDDEAVMLTDDVVVDIFTGNILEMLKVAFFVVEVNFGDFFALIPNLSGVREMLGTTK